MNNFNRNDTSKSPQGTAPTGRDSVQQGKDTRPASANDASSKAPAGKDAKGTESSPKS